MSTTTAPTPGLRAPESLAYLLLAVAGFVGTQAALIAIISGGDSASEVWEVLTGTPTAVFVTIDLFVVFLAAMVFMVLEGRRLGLRVWWLYPLLSVGIGVSTGFPLFLLARRLRVAAESAEPAVR